MGFLSRILGVRFDSPPPVGDSGKLSPNSAAPLVERIEAVLESVRPALHADGGDIELVEVVGRSAKVRLRGACDGCPSASLTLRVGIERKLKEQIPEFEDLIPL